MNKIVKEFDSKQEMMQWVMTPGNLEGIKKEYPKGIGKVNVTKQRIEILEDQNATN